MEIWLSTLHVYLWYPEVVIPFDLLKYAFVLVVFLADLMLDIWMKIAPVSMYYDEEEATNPVGD